MVGGDLEGEGGIEGVGEVRRGFCEAAAERTNSPTIPFNSPKPQEHGCDRYYPMLISPVILKDGR